MSIGCSALDDILLKTIASEHSNASSRQIINENFNALRKAFVCLQNLNINQLNGLIFPNPPQLNVQYSLQWNGTAYVLVESNNNPGIKNVIQPTDVIIVLPDYQYIVFDTLTLLGTLIVQGELVIL